MFLNQYIFLVAIQIFYLDRDVHDDRDVHGDVHGEYDAHDDFHDDRYDDVCDDARDDGVYQQSYVNE
tara:strand:- start:10 stop:210 length:201 start_codon:yes stop_codon:yes gene_type:complete